MGGPIPTVLGLSIKHVSLVTVSEVSRTSIVRYLLIAFS